MADKNSIENSVNLIWAFYNGEKRLQTVTVHTTIKSLYNNEQQLMSAVVTVIQLILVMPAIQPMQQMSAGSFNTMHRLKTYLRATM